MSEQPRSLRTASRARWTLASAAVLLIVVAGFLGWNEVVTDGSPAPRSFALTGALFLGFAAIAVSCTIFICRTLRDRLAKIEKHADERAREHTNEIVQAIYENKWENMLTNLNGDNVRPIDRKRR